MTTALQEVTMPVKKDVTVTEAEHTEAVKGFMHTCLKVRYVKAGLPKARKASSSSKQAVADNAGGADADSFSVTKRLFKAGKDSHPLIGKANDWASKVDKWRNTFTFSMAAAESTDAGELRKARGERLIRSEDIDDFETGLVAFEEEGRQLSVQLYEQYDQLIAMEKSRLRGEFRSTDYPAKDEIWQLAEKTDGTTEELFALRIGRRDYSEVTASIRLPAKVLERMTVQTAEVMNQSVEVAIADLTSVMAETFTTLARQLVDRVRIRPKFGTSVYKEAGAEAEVIKVVRDEEDRVTIEVSFKKDIKVEGVAKRQTVVQEFGPMSEAEYQALRPEPMDATKKLTTSVVERFGAYLDTFTNLQAKLGAYGSHMDETLDLLRELHHRALKGAKKKGAEGVIDSVKRDSKFRVELREALEGTCEVLQAVAEEAKTVRRKVHGHIAQQIAKAAAAKKKE